ncbi:MAG: hypothetical protein B7Y42_11370 [Polaromonas sp. 28-63-22]|nr:MAG: hypothetical protein B7Y42_11370 [Polaromonas sp. 28-63-22]
MIDRRQFVVQISAASGALMAGQAIAQPALLSETDPQAIALGYKADTTKVDAAKYPKHAATQECKNCALYQGKHQAFGSVTPTWPWYLPPRSL